MIKAFFACLFAFGTSPVWASQIALPEKRRNGSGAEFSISDLGAKEGVKATEAFAKAMAACEAAGGGRVVVPCGKWFTGAIRFRSNCELHLADGAEVVFSQDLDDYLPAVFTSWEGMECRNYCPLVYAYGCTNVAITGKGTLRAYEGRWEDTRWYPWVPQKNGIKAARLQLYTWGATDYPVEKREIWKMPNAHTRPHFIQFNRCRNVRLEDFKVRNSPFWTIHLYLCEDAIARGLDVYAHGNNNDGIDIEMSRNVLVEKCIFDQGDDGVVIKSGRNRDAWRIGKPTENVLVRDCEIRNAHTVLGIGSEISGGVRNVRMVDCTAGDVIRVFYLKTNRRRGGFMEDITCENVTARSAKASVFEIATDILYEWADFPDYENRTTPISGITARNIAVGSAKDVVRLCGDPSLPPKDIRWENVTADTFSGRELVVKNIAISSLVSPFLGAPQVRFSGNSLGSLVRDRLFNEVVRLDRAADARWTACKTRDELSARQTEVRRMAIDVIGGFPERTPLNAQTTGRVRKNGYVVEKVLFESRPGHYVTAHLFLPDDPKFKAPYPGVVSPCGHSLAGKAAPWYQRVGVTGAKMGFATLVYDPVEQGERHQLRDGAEQWSTVKEHNRIGTRATLLGWSTAQFRIWDGMRACDYLASRPDVDAERLGVTGMSGGGTLSSYLNALDGRFRAAAPAGFLSTVRDVFDNCGPQDAEQVLFGQLKFGFNHLGIVAARAPSPLMFVTTHADFFPFMGSVDTFENARRIFGMLGTPERVELMESSGPHSWYESTRHAAFLWMRRWLADDSGAWPCDLAELRRMDLGFEYDRENSGLAFAEPPVRNVTESGCVLGIAESRSVYDIMRNELERLDADRKAPSADDVRAAAGVRPLDAIRATPVAVRKNETPDGRAVRMLLSRDDDLTPIPLVAFLPKEAKGVPAIMFTDGERKMLDEEARRLLAEGRAVAVAEMRGFGETAKGGRTAFYGSARADEEMAMLSFAIGENLVARRAEDAAVAARHFAKMAGAGRVALIAFGAAAIPAAHARFLERGLFESVEVRSPPPSWRKIMDSPEVPFFFADTVHGALRTYDWPDLVE